MNSCQSWAARPRATVALRRFCLCLAVWGLAPVVWACTSTESGGNLGTVTSQQVKNGASITGSGSLSYTCGPVVLSALAGTPSLKATMQASVSGLTLKSGVNAIPYQVFSNPGLSTTYSGGLVVINLSGSSLLSLLNTAGGQVPIYIATTPGANIPAGTYTDTLQLTWAYQNICEGLVNLGGLCLGVLSNGSVTRSMVVSLVVTNDCTISAPTVNFGSAPLVSGFPTVSQNLSLLCTKGMTYTVGLGAGSHALGGRRHMASGVHRLAYDLFKADSTLWGSVTTARANGPAASDGISLQTIPYTARVYQDQATPAAAVYSDSVVVDVSF
jgi:spore coat protein U-like protein|nr:spore coat U domain-containing protein [uncultured Albidiferax sp.]